MADEVKRELARFAGPPRRLTLSLADFNRKVVRLNGPNGIQEATVVQLDRAMNRLADEVSDTIVSRMSEHKWDSPLETMFFTWWTVALLSESLWSPSKSMLTLQPQETVQCLDRKYRLDFWVMFNDADMVKAAFDLGVRCQRIGVELDGHDFHEKTKEQVAYRNRRDRDLQDAGWKVFHFSGSELHRDPFDCALQVVNFAGREYTRLSIEVWKRQNHS